MLSQNNSLVCIYIVWEIMSCINIHGLGDADLELARKLSRKESNASASNRQPEPNAFESKVVFNKKLYDLENAPEKESR